jgi:hypothetical protein
MSRSVGFEVSNKEEASLAQLIFEHDSFPVREDFSAMANIKTSEDYLKTDFVLDFYKYVVEEKLKNSSVYRNTLSAFVFSDNDISINRPIKSIEGLKYNQELKDYFSIKKDLSLNNLFKGESNIKLTADVKQFNNPNSVKEFQGTKYETKGYVIADESVDNILKVDGVLYKRAKGNVFAKITNIDTNYYSTNIAAPFEEEIVNKLNESSKIAFTKKEKPLEKVVEETKTTTEVTPVQPTNKQITKYVSQYLKDKLGSDISIMSEADMKRELAKRGYDSLQAMVNQETLLAPNGKPSNLTPLQYNLVRTPEFKAWFGDWINSPETASKVVDENGEPLVCYHGTKNKNINTFNNVNYNEIYEYDAYGIYSSESIENAKHYSGGTGSIITIFVDIKNPYNLGTRETDKGRPTDKNLRAISKERYEFYIEKGYDGVIFTDLRGIMFEIVALHPNQIKLADGSNTQFSSGTNNIQFLSTNDKIYGFYDENTKQIFLNESFLTSNSLIHEHWHAFKPILKDLANKGDLQAKLLIDTFRNTVDKAGVFNQAEFEARYDAQNQQEGQPVQFSILGEEGAQELDKYDESLSRLGQLELARKMKKDGQDPFSIRMATGWELNTVTDKWQYEIQPNMSIRKGVINNNNVFPGTTLEDLIDYPELFKAYPDLKNIKIKAVPYDEVNFEANYKPISNVIEISNYLLDETSRRLSPVLLHEIQHAIQVAEGYSPTSSQDIEEYVNTIQNIGLRSEYSDIQDNSEEILFETLGYFKEAYKSVEEYVYNPWSQNITNTLKFFFKNIHGVNVKTPKTIKSYSINGDRVYRMDEIARETEDSSKGIIEGLNKEIAILFERNSVSSEKDLNQQLNTEKDEERLDDLNSTKRVLNNIKNRISEVENGNFKVETTEDSPELELQDLLEAYNNQNNTSLTQDDVINDITSYVENNRKDEDDIYYRSQSEVEARNIEQRMNLSPEDRRMFVLSSTEDVDRADQLNISNGILGDMYSKIPNAYQNIWDEMYVNTYEDVLSKGLPISTIKVLIDQEARNKGVSVDEPILSKGIDKDAELIPVSELESFVGEFRAGKDKMVNSSETINKLKEDISKNGFKESIIVQYTKDGEASIVEGNHRFQAAKELGLSKIPVTFKRVDKLPNNVSSDFLNVSIKDNFSKTGADLGFTSYKITPYDYKGSSRLSTRLTSEVYNPRSGESKEDYIERMREEIEANLLGENSEAYFERIATENNLTEEAKKSFKEKLKKFVKIFSDWLARQLGFNNITPAEAAKLTTTDVLDRVTTSMLRGDFRPEELVKNKLKNAKAKASELQASKDSGLEIITPVDLQNIEECT